MKKLALTISKILNKKIILKKSPLKKGGTTIRVPDIKKIKKLGFKPRYSLKAGIRKILEN